MKCIHLLGIRRSFTHWQRRTNLDSIRFTSRRMNLGRGLIMINFEKPTLSFERLGDLSSSEIFTGLASSWCVRFFDLRFCFGDGLRWWIVEYFAGNGLWDLSACFRFFFSDETFWKNSINHLKFMNHPTSDVSPDRSVRRLDFRWRFGDGERAESLS
jgi:hypothetical protein